MAAVLRPWARYCRTESNCCVLLLCFAVSIFSLFAYGVDAGAHHTYNIYYHRIFLYPEFFSGTPLEIILGGLGARLFTLGLGPLLLNPHSVILLAVLFNVAKLFVGYRIARIFLQHNHALVLTIVIGLIANSPISGIIGNELIFTRKTVTTFLLLASFFSYLRDRLIIGGLLSAAALLLHPLNALSGLVFFLPGLTLYLFRYHSEKRLGLLGSYLPIIGTLLFTLISTSSLTDMIVNTSVVEWYRYSLIVEADDVAMFWKLRESSATLVPLLVLSFVVSALRFRQNYHSEPTIIHWISILQLPLIILLVIFELLQVLGVSLGEFSEVFSEIQFRRGIWVPALVALLVLFQHVIQKLEATRRPWLIAACIAALLDHTLAVTFLALIGLSIAFPGKAIRIGILVSVVTLMWPILNDISQLSSRHELMHVGLFVFLGVLFVLLQRTKRPAVAVAIILIVHSSFILANNNLRHNVFADSYNHLVTPDTPQGYAAQAERDIIITLDNLPKSKSSMVLFAPVALGYAAQVMAKHRLFLSRWDNMLIYNRSTYTRFLEKTKALGISPYVCGTDFGSNISCILQTAQRRIDELTIHDLAILKAKFDILFVVRTHPLEGKEAISSNQKFHIYKL